MSDPPKSLPIAQMMTDASRVLEGYGQHGPTSYSEQTAELAVYVLALADALDKAEAEIDRLLLLIKMLVAAAQSTIKWIDPDREPRVLAEIALAAVRNHKNVQNQALFH